MDGFPLARGAGRFDPWDSREALVGRYCAHPHRRSPEFNAMADSRLQFDVSFGPRGGRARQPDAPLRMLVLADLGGSQRVPLAQRRPVAVDIDNFDAVFARTAPALAFVLDGLPVDAAFESMDDFHPDALVRRLAPFDALRRLRAELDDPARFRQAAAALGLSAPTPAPAPAAADAGDIERLLGRKPTAPAAVPQDAASVLQGWLGQLMAPHVVAQAAPEQRAWQAAADEALGALMRQVLHHPAFQTLEASWRGLDRLVRGLDLGEALQLQVLDVGRDEIEADLAAHRDDLSGSALHALLCGGASDHPGRWGMLVLDQAFGPSADEVQALAALGAMAARAGAPLLAAAAPQALGCSDAAQLTDPQRWAAPDATALAHWAALRSSPMAGWIGLVAPRVLMRLPYGATSDRIASFAFEELPAPHQHNAFLWGHGAMAMALLAGQAFQADGWAMDLSSQLVLDDLPSAVIRVGDERLQQPCAEWLLSEPAAQAMGARGVMALMSWRNRPAARLLQWHSLADPPSAIQGF
jgi:type VI secretion system protein ImpC